MSTMMAARLSAVGEEGAAWSVFAIVRDESGSPLPPKFAGGVMI